MIKKLELQSQHFYDMVHQSNLHFRHGMDHLLFTCSKLEVPLVIVSAAVDQVVEKSVDILIDEMNDKKRKSKIMNKNKPLSEENAAEA